MDENGVPLFHATKRKLRQFPVGFGGASYGVTQWDAEVAEVGSRFFRRSGVRGLAEAEFKRDPRDGVVKLIECNHRFTGSNELVRVAGIDLALLAYNRAIGRPDPPLGSYRDGVYLWGPILDTRAFRALRRQGELTTVDWVRSLLHRQHFPVFRFHDPKPTVMDVSRRAKLVLGELVGNSNGLPFARASAREH
jgi:predicted ATP-grasp superfamily ATP-dependent carboligase